MFKHPRQGSDHFGTHFDKYEDTQVDNTCTTDTTSLPNEFALQTLIPVSLL